MVNDLQRSSFRVGTGAAMNEIFYRFWGEAVAVLDRSRRVRLVDLLVVLGIVGLVFATTRVAHQWSAAPLRAVTIDLDPPRIASPSAF